jgi:general secretion pathway protein G
MTREEDGFSLVELMIIAAMLATLVSIAVPIYARALDSARMAHAIAEIQTLQKEIFVYEVQTGNLPLTLEDIDRQRLTDPWGTPYEYLNFSSINGKGKMRKDRFLVPLNSRYDLYSKGPDRDSQPPLTAKASRDDIILANDGSFVGPASQF